jgi:DNA-binding CsgD family transcriptional regulator
MTGPGVRFVVLEDHPPGVGAEIAAEFAGLRGRVIDGWHRAAPGTEAVCVGAVRDARDAAAAVLCAVGGARLVVEGGAEREVMDRLCDDLRRLGELDHRIGDRDGPRLSADERALLALLLGGATLGQAARELHISRRTADRRLAAARTGLDARTTAEAVAAAARLGVRPAPVSGPAPG